MPLPARSPPCNTLEMSPISVYMPAAKTTPRLQLLVIVVELQTKLRRWPGRCHHQILGNRNRLAHEKRFGRFQVYDTYRSDVCKYRVAGCQVDDIAKNHVGCLDVDGFAVPKHVVCL